MAIERQPLARIQQKESVEQARQTALTGIRTKLDALSTALGAVKSTTAWGDVQTVESSDSSAVAAVRTGGAAAGAYPVWVKQLARADQIRQQSPDFVKAASADTLKITVGSASVSVNVAANDDVAAIASKINGSSGSPVYASVVSGKLVLSGKTVGADARIAVADGAAGNGYDLATELFGARQTNAGFTTASAADTLTLSAGGASMSVAIDLGDDVTAIAGKINDAGGPVAASVVDGSLRLTAAAAGADVAVTVADGAAGNGYDLATDLFGGMRLAHGNANALVSLDGSTYVERASNTVTDLLPGVKLTLKAAGPDPTTITVGAPGPDTDAIAKQVQSVIDAYNAAVDAIRSKVNEKRVASPTTDAERAKGVLNGDPGLTALLTALRGSVSATVAGLPDSMKTLVQAGVSTGKGAGKTLDQDAIAGKLSLDTDTLTSALQSSFDSVKALVAGSGGLAVRFQKLLDPWLTGTPKSAAIFDGRLQASRDAVKAFQSEEADMNLQLTAKQQRLEAQFTAMETALSSAQNQGSWLASQIARM